MASKNKNTKWRDLAAVLGIYLLAYAVGILASLAVKNTMLRCFVFDVSATVVTFLFSVFLRNSSVYDPYWSLTPFVISVALFIRVRALSVWHILFLAVFALWSWRLTGNWMTNFTDFSYEDWRYRKFRDESSAFTWPIINFCGIHMMPTLWVFAGMLPLFAMIDVPLGPWSLFGMAVILFGTALEFFADRDMRAHLAQKREGAVCETGLWRYSRHPNYLGEILVWVGVFLTVIPYAPGRWYYGFGWVSIAVMFLVVSIPMMEKRQRKRRPAYDGYCRKTSMLLLLPTRK